MNQQTSIPCIDGHVHPLHVSEMPHLLAVLDAVQAEQAGLACQDEDRITTCNPAGFILKARAPRRIFLLAGLEHSSRLFGVEAGLDPASQAERMTAAGADGFKLLAAKPTGRKRLGLPLNSPYFCGFFERCAIHGRPVLCHVGDPEEFWIPSRLPGWARRMGWGYDATFPKKEQRV